MDARTYMDSHRLARIDAYARATGQSREDVVNKAMDRFLDYEEWFLREVDKGLMAADAGRFVESGEVDAVFHKFRGR